MVFSSPTFLFYFLPLTILAYFIVGRIGVNSIKKRNKLLLTASLLFIFFGSGQYILLILLTTLSSFIFGKLIYKHQKKSAFIISLATPLLSLFVFKYANFVTKEFDSIAHIFGLNSLPITSFVLPIGISFYTFQNLSYLMDIRFKGIKPEDNYFDLLLYIAMFPQLIAGPIVRYTQVNKELHSRSTSINDFQIGCTRFIYGLAKKIIIADACGKIADLAYAVPLDDLTTGVVYLGAICYFLQIYFDFSAYSDMAIGLGKILGFKFPENFNRPYSSFSLTEFWRRWHITLSSWFRDYLYIPLGGSRGGTLQTYFNLWIVFVVTGIWHGANWTFLLWGIYNGLILSFEKLFNIRSHTKYIFFWRSITIFLVFIGWIIFRAESLNQAIIFYYYLFDFSSLSLPYEIFIELNTERILYILIGLTTVFFPATFVFGKLIEQENNHNAKLIRLFVIFILLPYTLIVLSGNNYSPFIYFQF